MPPQAKGAVDTQRLGQSPVTLESCINRALYVSVSDNHTSAAKNLVNTTSTNKPLSRNLVRCFRSTRFTSWACGFSRINRAIYMHKAAKLALSFLLLSLPTGCGNPFMGQLELLRSFRGEDFLPRRDRNRCFFTGVEQC